MRSSRLVQILLAVGFASACSSWLPGDDAPSLDGNRRLGTLVVPLHYALDLRIDPSRDRFSGEAVISVELKGETDTIQLHAADMDLTRVEVLTAGRSHEVAYESGTNGALELRLAEPLAAGQATLRFAWDAPLPETPFGLYRVLEGERWYAFTQFEPLEARKAFPGFDQPEFKTPYAVTLRVPSGQLALANGPVVSRSQDAGQEVYVFAETPPLPTYLVAFAVGEFDVVGPSPEEGPPTRIVAAHGKGVLAHYALERTPVILRWLSDYFDHPYPFAKLDLVAVPNFGLGAMENVGLVTFRESLLLLDGARAPIWNRRSSQSVIAHELSHMWYGNLVTMAWWDDLWLNESFATWMAAKVLTDVDPELEAELDAVSYVQYTMYLDSKRDARQVRQPIHDAGDVYNAFDGITYGKGGALLRMVEAWIGEDAFRAAVRAYMRQHAFGSGGTQELLSALETASGQPVARTMKWFLDQPGTPLVDVALRCESDAPPALQLKQTRYLPKGSGAAIGEPWQVPVCVAFGAGSQRGRQCFLLTGREQQVSLTQAESCPDWIHPNEGERGYYRWSMPREDLLALATSHGSDLDVAERVALPGHFEALVEAGILPVEDHLAALTQLATDDRRQVQGAVARALGTLYEVGVPRADSSLGRGFAARVRELLTPHVERVGIHPQAGESVDARMRRAALLPVLGSLGRDPAIRLEAEKLAKRFVQDPAAVPEETVGLLLPIAAEDGDAALWEALVRIARDPPSPAIRRIVVRSLGRFGDPELVVKSLNLVLDDSLRAQDYRTIAGRIRPPLRDTAWEWMEEHYGEIVARLGPLTSTQLPRIASGLCSAEDEARVEAFFGSVSGAPSGTGHNTRLVLEDISRCVQMRQAILPGLKAVLGAGGDS